MNISGSRPAASRGGVSRVVLATSALLLFAACTVEYNPDLVPWATRSMSLLEKGDCAAAISELQKVDVSSRTETWYSLASVSSRSCFAEEPGEPYRDWVVESMQEGERRFPESAMMRVHTASVLHDLGRADEASAKLAEAKGMAESVLRSSADARERGTAERALSAIAEF